MGKIDLTSFGQYSERILNEGAYNMTSYAEMATAVKETIRLLTDQIDYLEDQALSMSMESYGHNDSKQDPIMKATKEFKRLAKLDGPYKRMIKIMDKNT